jgi:hypothetical protein
MYKNSTLCSRLGKIRTDSLSNTGLERYSYTRLIRYVYHNRGETGRGLNITICVLGNLFNKSGVMITRNSSTYHHKWSIFLFQAFNFNCMMLFTWNLLNAPTTIKCRFYYTIPESSNQIMIIFDGKCS